MKKIVFIALTTIFLSSAVIARGEEFPIICELKEDLNFNSRVRQTFNFGSARPILNRQHPNTAKITYWFPSFFIIGLLVSVLLFFVGKTIPLVLICIYFLIIYVDALIKNKSIVVAFYSIWATFIQFWGYGSGFLRSMIRLQILQKSSKDTFPEMFR